jgi:hypothetical protein
LPWAWKDRGSGCSLGEEIDDDDDRNSINMDSRRRNVVAVAECRKGRLTSIGKELFEVIGVDCEARQKVSAIDAIDWPGGKGVIKPTVLGESVQRDAVDVVGRSHPWSMCLVAWIVNLA